MGDNAVERRLRELIGHLPALQEEERRRVGVCASRLFQPPASVAGDRSRAAPRQPRSSPSELTSRLQELSEQTNGISSRVYRLSHELRPAKLEALGLSATLQGYCDEMSEQNNVRVTFDAYGRTNAIPAAVALCVFRVTQEALDNVVHGGASFARVQLTTDDQQLSLSIEDDGVGFEWEGARRESLGLAIMHERLHALGGDLRVESTRLRGARLEIRIPLAVDVAAEEKP